MGFNSVQPRCLLLLSTILCQWMMRGIFYVRWDLDVSERRSLILSRHNGGPGGLRPCEGKRSLLAGQDISVMVHMIRVKG